MGNQHVSTMIVLALTCGASGWAFAVEAPVYVLEPRVVTAQHFEREALEVPADVVFLDRETIDDSGVLSLPALLQQEVNLFFRSFNGRIADGDVSMRGFGDNSGLRSLVLLDGQPLNPADMGGIAWEQVPLDAIASVEVLRGGHNVLYGDQALAGVIKIETRRAAGQQVVLDSTMGSDHLYHSSVSAAYGDEQWSIRVGGAHQQEEGYRHLADAWTQHGYASVGYELSTGDDMHAHVSWREGFQHFPGSIDAMTYLRTPEAAQSDLARGAAQSREAGGLATMRFAGERSWGSWQVQGGYDVNNNDWTLNGRFGQNDQTGWTLRPRLQLEYLSSRLIFGGDFLYDTLGFTDYLNAARNIAKAEAQIQEQAMSAYFLLEKALGSHFTLSSGYRHTWNRFHIDNNAYVVNQLSQRTNRGVPNPLYKYPADLDAANTFDDIVEQDGSAFELSLNYRIDEQWSMFTGYDRLYRYPVTDERAAYQGVALAVQVSPVDAEEGDSVEVGLKYLGQAHEFYVTAYAFEMDNEIGYIEINGLGQNINMGRVRRLGGDLSWVYKQEDWGWSTRLAWVDTEMRHDEQGGQGQQVPMVPNIHTTSMLWWKPWKQLRLKGVHRYVGSQFQGNDFANTLTKIDSYHLVDLHLDAQLTQNVKWFAGVTNIFDQLYAEAVFAERYYPGPGRAYFTGIKLLF